MNSFKDNRKQKFSKSHQEKNTQVKNEKQLIQKINRLKQRAQATHNNLEQVKSFQENGEFPEWRDHTKVMKKTENRIEVLENAMNHLARVRRSKH